MDKDLLRKVQLAQLEITKEVRRVCDENDIKYFLDSGTLLGAIRHSGFIPWDDDMDIGMLRNDYEKFLEIAPAKLNDSYYLQTWDNDENYPLAFAKVRKKGTKYVEAIAQYSGAANEIYVDVFPYDVYLSDEKEAIKNINKICHYKKIILMQCNYKPWIRHEKISIKVLVFFKYLPYLLLGKFADKKRLKGKCQKNIFSANKDNNVKWYYIQGGAQRKKIKIPAECMDVLETISFENEIFTCPSNSDKVLSLMYGDYMKLPPIDQRENRHQIIEVVI